MKLGDTECAVRFLVSGQVDLSSIRCIAVKGGAEVVDLRDCEVDCRDLPRSSPPGSISSAAGSAGACDGLARVVGPLRSCSCAVL